MSEPYNLFYWPLPFRGQLIRYVLAHVGAVWHEAEFSDIRAIKEQPVHDQPTPFMAPPLLFDPDNGLYIAQMNAVLIYLAEKHQLMPASATKRALTQKILGDINDVLDEMTLFGGRSMWEEGSWKPFVTQRLPRWLQIFERTATDHGATLEAGTMLGTDDLGLTDLATAALWFSMMDNLPALTPVISHHAPVVAALSRRVAKQPAIAALIAEQKANWGDLYCGGQIEQSIRKMVDEFGVD
ncbi:glutathione S-transferase [Cohaesibacter celericrescens]|uniref:glutathione S-transferase n=1 Tax=Cohaesibacter celericrescens TaxID=2067669 RepID=UPI0035694260